MAHPYTFTGLAGYETTDTPSVPDKYALEPSVLGVPIRKASTEVSKDELAAVGVVLKDGVFLNTISPTRKFDTGATRDQDATKFDYEGFLSPLALNRFAAYMHENRVQSDGTLRDSDNWQKGIPRSSYMKSLWRHLVTVWRWHRRAVPVTEAIACESMEEALCGVIFNAQGYLHEIMKEKEGE